jgi:hypothetical protein
MIKKNTLEGFSDGEVGDVDMFGLDEFGMPQGTDPLWGAVIGGGVGTSAAMLARKFGKSHTALHKYSEAVGFLVAGAAGGAMVAFPNTRRMGWAAIATAFVTNGVRQLEHSLFPTKFSHQHLAAMHAHAMATDGTASAADMKAPMSAPGGWDGGFGIHSIEPGYPVPSGYVGPGLGAAVIDAAYPIPGSVSQSGSFDGGGFNDAPVGPPTLLGAGDYGLNNNPAVQQNTLLGGPTLSALGAHFGSTLFSNN